MMDIQKVTRFYCHFSILLTFKWRGLEAPLKLRNRDRLPRDTIKQPVLSQAVGQ